MTAAARLARFVAARSWNDLSDAAREDLKIRILDALGCALGGLDAPPARAIRAQLDDFGGHPLCTLSLSMASVSHHTHPCRAPSAAPG